MMKASAISVQHCQNRRLVFLDLFLDDLQPWYQVILSQAVSTRPKPPAQFTDVRV